MNNYLCFSRRQLHKCPTQPQLIQSSRKLQTTSTIHSSSSQSIQSVQQEYKKLVIKWILDFQRKITKDSNHLAVWYFQLAIDSGLVLKESNWQIIAATLILMATKMNQIYPPSINSIIKRCDLNFLKKNPISRSQILSMQESILKILNFDIAQQSPYSLIIQKLGDNLKETQQCQKLLKIIYPFKDICKNSAQRISDSVIYLICRDNSYIKSLNIQQIKQTKTFSDKIYQIYKKVKILHEQKKSQMINKCFNNQFKENLSKNQQKNCEKFKQSTNCFISGISGSQKLINQNQNTKPKSFQFYSKQNMRFSYKNLFLYA